MTYLVVSNASDSSIRCECTGPKEKGNGSTWGGGGGFTHEKVS